MQSPNELGLILPFQLMLPDAEDTPAFGTKATAHQAVADLVSLDLASPKRGPGSRPGRVPGTAVPEATSTNTATCSRWETKSGLAGSLEPRRQSVMPIVRKI
jgi:hypothetical protein